MENKLLMFLLKICHLYEDVAMGSRRLLTDYPGINGAPAWSPDGGN